MKTLFKLLKENRAATAVEMGLICALIVLAIIGAINGFAGAAITMWGNVAQQTSEATNPAN